ncbi:winged helix-turn-helix domain-containing protein [Mucilaginibacter ginsenosidivorax]|uniref:Winged helix-turn-helix domain-containing protein n=1 Tax=Mucilaginibacter ginsenosidivorax TaxID=862126 RepID=A0A5B8W9B1_9SPHI|nr:crosslink repair DNA glycosylase YcaQ family protein [Mucilaginibacter ginsenosidivorax]QEC78838.1 winged helix-turn-helix domain-containing protein [Mucilaginibacter ginsenosidivorax]
MEPLTLTKPQARKIILYAAGLARQAQFGTGIEAVYRLIDHLGFVQLDTNYVVERAHHHVMAARVPDYEPEWLGELTADGRIFEYFTSDAGYIPMGDFRFSLPVKEGFSVNRKPVSPAETRLMKQVLDRVEREGPLMVGDFENDRLEASSGWWDWRPAKVALERLYLDGKLTITRTKAFHKVYDVPMNLIPADTDLTMPSAEEFARFVIMRTLGALGIAYVKEMAWRARYVKGNLVKKELEKMVATGEVRMVQVEGLKSAPLYMLPHQQTEVELAGDVFILSPFDILNVFRHRLKDFFDFDYQIECFVPAPKRKYGYFSLPILVGDTFVARMDAKADRKQKVLLVHNLHFEDVELDEAMIGKIIVALKAFVQFNKCRDIVFKRCNREDYMEVIGGAF